MNIVGYSATNSLSGSCYDTSHVSIIDYYIATRWSSVTSEIAVFPFIAPWVVSPKLRDVCGYGAKLKCVRVQTHFGLLGFFLWSSCSR